MSPWGRLRSPWRRLRFPRGRFSSPWGRLRSPWRRLRSPWRRLRFPWGRLRSPWERLRSETSHGEQALSFLVLDQARTSAKLSEVSTHLGPERAETPTLAVYLQTVASPAAAHLGCAGIAQYTPVGRLWEELWFAPDQSRIPRNHPNPELFSKIDRSQTRIFRPSWLRRDCAIHSRGATLGGALVRS